MASTNQAIEAIAAEIGSAIYIDVAKWHLYLREAHLHTPLAEALYPMMADGKINEGQVKSVLQAISVPLGGGKKTLTLLDLIPSSGIMDLMDVLEECQRDL
ncbi:MAG: DUF3181 family protein [Cyanobacteria bacterium P01_F01_bin.150]